jgi:hypothetical protein
MTTRALISWIAGTLLVSIGATTIAQQTASDDTSRGAPAQEVTDAELTQLIKDLDADRFSERQDATRELKELGEPAIAKLAETVQGTSREASRRALEILKSHFAGDDNQLKQAAKAALEKLAESESAPVAQKAKALLDPKPPAVAPPRNPFGGARINVQFQIGGVQRVQMRDVNGVKDIDIKEQDRSIKIHEDPDKGITVEIVEKKDGKDVKEKYEAKDVAELKKKHPEAHKVYDKYHKGGRIQIKPPILVPGVPIQGLQPPGKRAGRRRLIETKPIIDQLEQTAQQLEEARQQMQQLEVDGKKTESLQKALERLDKARKSLDEVKRKLG